MARTSKSVGRSLELEGADVLRRQLDKLEDAVASKRVIAAALHQGARILRDEARRRAPVGPTGRLSKNIDIGEQKITPAGGQVAVGPNRTVFYGRFVELGEGHGPAQPFLRPAFDAKRAEIAIRINRELRGNILRELALMD